MVIKIKESSFQEMSKQNKPRDHHIIPQYNLRHFTCSPNGTKREDQEIWTYGMLKGEARRTSIRSTGFEKDFYSIMGENGEKDPVLETDLAKLDGFGATAWLALLKGQRLESIDKLSVSVTLALTLLRTKSWQLKLSRAWLQMSLEAEKVCAEDETLFLDYIQFLERQKGRSLTEEERNLYREDMKDPMKYAESIGFVMGKEWSMKESFSHFWYFVGILSKMNWTQLHVPNRRFLVTSDYPMTGHLSEPPKRLKSDIPDKQLQCVNLTLPLSPTRCWWGHWDNSLPSETTLSAEGVKLFNKLRVQNAERFLYADRLDKGILNLSKKYKESSPSENSNSIIDISKFSVSLKR